MSWAVAAEERAKAAPPCRPSRNTSGEEIGYFSKTNYAILDYYLSVQVESG